MRTARRPHRSLRRRDDVAACSSSPADACPRGGRAAHHAHAPAHRLSAPRLRFTCAGRAMPNGMGIAENRSDATRHPLLHEQARPAPARPERAVRRALHRTSAQRATPLSRTAACDRARPTPIGIDWHRLARFSLDMTPRGAAVSHLRVARVPVHRTSGPRAARRAGVRSRKRTPARYTAGQKPGRLAMATAVAPLRGRPSVPHPQEPVTQPDRVLAHDPYRRSRSRSPGEQR